jgi:2-polyprenyl-3-methyl-5-hydroxy-6-metoxy-1,4-benzoquinol methylase
MKIMENESKNAKSLHEKRKASYLLVDDYHKKFINPVTGVLFDHLKEERNCPVCHSSSGTHILDKSASTYYRCNECSMVYLNPILNPQATIDYYTNLNTGQGDTVSADSRFYTEIYTMGLDSIELHKKEGKILDIGCSTGFFLDIAKCKGWDTAGIELGLDEAAKAEEKGHRIFKNTIDELGADEQFDAITMWDVLEHIPDGIDQLNKIKSHLTDKGVLFFQIPNSDALAAKVMRGACRMFDGLEHTNLYNPKAVTLLAEKCGYTIKNIRSVISEIAVVNNYLDYLDPYFGTSQYENKVLNLFDEKFIHENKIGYKLQVTLEKI